MFDSPSYQTYAAPKAEPPSTMSLRDYFAGQVLPSTAEDYHPDAAAKLAYEYADAMLAAREVKP